MAMLEKGEKVVCLEYVTATKPHQTEPLASYIPFHGLIASKKTLYTYTVCVKVLMQSLINSESPHGYAARLTTG